MYLLLATWFSMSSGSLGERGMRSTRGTCGAVEQGGGEVVERCSDAQRQRHKPRQCAKRESSIPPQLYQGRLHGVIPLPAGEAGELLGVDDAVAGVHAGEVDLADELEGRGLVGVVWAAVHADGVDAVLVDALGGILLACGEGLAERILVKRVKGERGEWYNSRNVR
jgi:hypothetical protein